jgi:DNA adenine methylase
MLRCKGKVMVSINDHPDIRRVFEGFHFETLEIRYCNSNQRQGKAEPSGELVIMNWIPTVFGGVVRIGYLKRTTGCDYGEM